MFIFEEFANGVGFVSAVLAAPLAAVGFLVVYVMYRSANPKPNTPTIVSRLAFLNRRWLVGVLIALTAVAYSVDIADRLGWLNPIYAAMPLHHIFDQVYSDQTVVVDGNDFIDCTFVNVNFRYRGGYYMFENAHIGGSVGMDTPGDAETNTTNLLHWLDAQTPNHLLISNWRKLPPEHFK